MWYNQACMSLLEDLRSLSVVLPPSERVVVGEVADVLSALIAKVEHGNEIITAAGQGPQAVHDFLHDRIVAQAPDGAQVIKGATVESAPANQLNPPVVQGPTGIDPARFEQLVAAVEALAQQQQQKSSEPEATAA